MKKLINFIPSGVFSVIATAIVTYLLLSPSSSMSHGWLHIFNFKYGDKVVHIILFLFLNFAYLYDYTKYKSPHHTRVNKELAFTVLACTIGLFTETGQLVMGLGRDFDVLDIVADVVGAFIAFGIMRWNGSHFLRKYLFSARHRSRRGKRRRYSKRH